MRRKLEKVQLDPPTLYPLIKYYFYKVYHHKTTVRFFLDKSPHFSTLFLSFPTFFLSIFLAYCTPGTHCVRIRPPPQVNKDL
jgi:hypothetical protein